MTHGLRRCEGARDAAQPRLRVLDVDSEALPAALVERYLAVKRQGLL